MHHVEAVGLQIDAEFGCVGVVLIRSVVSLHANFEVPRRQGHSLELLKIIDKCQIDLIELEVKSEIWHILPTNLVTRNGRALGLLLLNLSLNLGKLGLLLLLGLLIFTAKHATEKSFVFILLFFDFVLTLLDLCLIGCHFSRPYVQVSRVDPEDQRVVHLCIAIGL